MKDTDVLNEILNDAVSDSTDSPPLPETTKAKMLANINTRISASAPEGTYTITASNEWEAFDEGISRQVLLPDDGGGTETTLYRLAPGASLTSHEHTHQETCWVVEGDILVGDHLVQAGDMHVANVGFTHPLIVARSEAILLIRSQSYRGPLTPD